MFTLCIQADLPSQVILKVGRNAMPQRRPRAPSVIAQPNFDSIQIDFGQTVRDR